MEKLVFCSVHEVAQLLGVTTTRVKQLMDSVDFPKPYQELKVGPIWERSVILEYKTEQDEKYRRVNKLLRPQDQVTKHGQGSDMKAVMRLHNAAKNQYVTKQQLYDVLQKNGWLDYYRSLVRNPLV